MENIDAVDRSRRLEKLIRHIFEHLSDELTRDEIIKMKRMWAKDNNETNVPTNIEVLKTYKKMLAE